MVNPRDIAGERQKKTKNPTTTKNKKTKNKKEKKRKEGNNPTQNIVQLSHLISFRLCPSTAGCSPPSMSSIFVCLLPSYSRWFPPSLLCHLAIFCLVVLSTSSLSLAATLCIALSTYYPLILLYDRPISTAITLNKTLKTGCMHNSAITVCRQDGKHRRKISVSEVIGALTLSVAYIKQTSRVR